MKHFFTGLRRAASGQPTDGKQRAASLPLLKPLGLMALLLSALGARAQQRPAPSFFSEDAAARQAATASPLAAALRHARPLTLDAAGLRAALAGAPLEGQPNAAPVLLALPLPDGSTGRFRVVESPVMEPGLAAKFPAIRTYSGLGVDDPTATVRLDLTPAGFHAQILSDVNGTVYIDPATRTDTQHYLSFARTAMPGRPWQCEVASQAGQRKAGSGPLTAQRTAGTSLRTYRLAMAATGEYTTFHGGTVALAQAAIATTVNRVVGVYEKELAVRLVLIANNSLIMYTNANTDPYTNGNGSSLLTENQTNIDAVIGPANYDVGHVFGTGGGGLAGLGVVCRAGQKAQGETGSSSPVGDSFDIDYVAHELGHQFGANHTFNSVNSSCNGNRNASTAFEPGSGTTIMAYAGICGASDNTQNNSNAYFHVASYEEIQAYLATTTCGTTTSTGNNAPTVTLPDGGKVLPIGTPFKLTAVGSDVNGDALSYCWEEYDLGPGGSPTATQTAGSTVPLFRSFTPTASGTRYFPQLSYVIAGTAPPLGERLPTVTRNLNFRVTVRDQHLGSAGVVGGLNSSPTVSLSSSSTAGPFVVLAPNTAVTWAGNSTQTVTWNVAGTSAAPVSCAVVNIRLSLDGGLTYPTVLLANTPNNGSATVTVPSTASTTARVMVEAADNYFFDISDTNFTITAPTPCAAPTALSISNITANTARLSFTASGSATGYVVTTTPATSTYTVAASPVNLTGLQGGTAYTVNVVSYCAASATSAATTVSFTTAAPPPCAEVTNLSVGSITTTTASASFTASPGATNYTLTTVPATSTYTVTASPVNLTGLTANTVYTLNVVTNCSNGGSATASVSFGTPPNNDECSGAVALLSGTTCAPTTSTVTGATQSQAASTCNGFASPTANDVWYSFVATGPSHIVTINSQFDAVLQVFSGTCGSLNSLGCSDVAVAGNEVVSLSSLTANTRYFVRVYPYSAPPADGTFTICVTGPVAPTCAAPTGLSAGSVTSTSASVAFTANALGTAYTVTTVPATTTQTVTASPVSLMGLSPATAYTVNIATTCTNGATSAAATTSFSTSAACAAPTGLAATGVSSSAASVSFTASGTASTYTVTTSPATTTQTVSASPVSFTGLTPGTTYTVSLVSNCAGGTTASPATVSFTTSPAAPAITLLSPNSGPVGTAVTITGTALTGATAVQFNGTAAGFTVVSPTFISTTVPAGATTGNVVVTTPGGPSNGLTFTVPLPTTTAWLGGGSTDWFGAANWSAGVPSSTLDATVPAGTSPYPLIASGSAVARSLTIGSGASLTQTGGTLAVQGTLANSGTLSATGGTLSLNGTAPQAIGGSGSTQLWTLTVANPAGATLAGPLSIRSVLALSSGNLTTNGQPLTLLSDATGTALVDNTGGVVNGPATVQRYIDPVLNTGAGYRHYSAPVSGLTIAGLTTAGFTPVANAAYNGSTAPGGVVPFPTVFGYDESRLLTSPAAGFSPFDKGWVSPADLNDPLTVGRGYTVNIAATQKVSFVGSLTNGPVSRPLARSGPDGGWHLVGNPYPSPLDWSRVSIPAGLDNAMYVFQSTSQYGGTYRSYVNGIGNPLVALGQAFFVRVSSGTASTTLTLTNAARETTPAATTFNRGPETRPLLQLTLRAPGARLTDDAYVYFEAGATPGVDARYDALKIQHNPGAPSLFILTAGTELSISGLPELVATTVVPLGLDVPQAGTYTLEAAQLLNLSTPRVYLHDALTGQHIDLHQQPAYSFTVGAATSLTGRFSLTFEPARVLATASNALAAGVSVYPNPARGSFTVLMPAVAGARSVEASLFNSLGQRVSTQTTSLPAAGTQLLIDAKGLASGVYQLRLRAGDALITKRVTIY